MNAESSSGEKMAQVSVCEPDARKYEFFSAARRLLQERQSIGLTKSLISTSSPQKQVTVHSQFECGGNTFIKLPNVFLSDRHFEEYIECLPLPEKDGSVLEVGCGTGWGICTLYLKNKERITQLLATDISAAAIENTKLNFKRHSIPGNVIFSDVFNAIPEDQKFDLIFWNVPFYHVPDDEHMSTLDRSIADAGYRSIERYIKDSDNHLTPRGKVAILFSPDCGNMAFLRHIAERNGKRLDVVWRSDVDGILHNYKVAFELYLVSNEDEQKAVTCNGVCGDEC